MRKKFTFVASLAFAAALCAGVGAANFTADAQVDWADFKITETAVRLGDGTEQNPTGLRFKVNCPDVDLGETAEYYTILSFESSVVTEANPNGEAKQYNAKVPATKWRADGSGWNAVLLEIPASDYVTEITATSYVEVDGEVVHTSNTATTSIAKTASKVLNGGMVDDKLDAFVSAIETEITLDKQSATFNQLNTSAALTASLPEAYDGYAVTWKSSNENVATVDKNGNVTAVGNGSATISANLGNNTATFEATAENMAITFSEEVPVEFVTFLGSSNNPANASLAELSVVDFNGGKAFGKSSFTGQADVYPVLSYSAMKNYFTAYPDAVGVTFDIYTVDRPAYLKVYTRTASTQGNDNLAVNITYNQERAGDYWKTTALVTKAFFNRLTADLDLLCRLRYVNGISEVYFDNVGVIVNDYEEGGAFDAMALHPVGFFGSSNQNGMDVTAVSIDGAEEKTNMLITNKGAASSSTTYFYVDGAYLEEVFADEKVTHFQFDIIANWNGTLANLQIQDNTYTNLQIASGADATAVTVDGAAGYYKLTVRYSREQFELAKVTNGKYVSYGNQIVFRYVYGGSVTTAAYLGNFKGVTVYNVLSGSYGTRYTVSANSETGATYTSTSSTYELCFDQNKMVDAFYTQGAESISFTLEASGYDIVGFRTWSGELVYCRPIIHLTDSSNTAPAGNAEFEIVDGKAVITIDASFFTPYFDENGAYKAGSIPDTTSAVGFGMRLSVLWGWGVDADGKQNEVIPNGTNYTISNLTLNFAE